MQAEHSPLASHRDYILWSCRGFYSLLHFAAELIGPSVARTSDSWKSYPNQVERARDRRGFDTRIASSCSSLTPAWRSSAGTPVNR
jgi:hypothetical protein